MGKGRDLFADSPNADFVDADPREVESEVRGTPVRDGAVDPQDGDYLGPSNAGQANPHGPAVVNPERRETERTTARSSSRKASTKG